MFSHNWLKGREVRWWSLDFVDFDFPTNKKRTRGIKSVGMRTRECCG